MTLFIKTINKQHSQTSLSKTSYASKPLHSSKPLISMLMGLCLVSIVGCQTTKGISNSSGQNVSQNGLTEIIQRPERLQRFDIQGKIGVTTPQTETQEAQSGSAFYTWAQEDNRFAIDLTGAMGIGHTVIQFDGVTATIVSERTGEMTAQSPEELLTKATGWSAPISQFSYWLSGSPAPSDNNNVLDDYGRIQTAYNGEWTANFSYNQQTADDYLPKKIKVVRNDGHKVIMTINHLRP